jgi:predicted Zn-dependent peptidase
VEDEVLADIMAVKLENILRAANEMFDAGLMDLTVTGPLKDDSVVGVG